MILYVEKLGGLANFGGARARIRSRGQLETEKLSAQELQAVDSLFHGPSESEGSTVADGFRFRISRITATGTETVDAPESRVPAALASCLKDEFV
jgi:hypothetical protein